MSDSFYNFSANSLRGKKVNFEEYKGKTILVVNTASQCGLTPQYEGLETLYNKYKDDGLVILGFPCNQFGQQEPGGVDEIEATCSINYGVTFPMFEKVDVNGDSAHPLLKKKKKKLHGWFGNKIKWNFTKFLIDSNGNPVKRFAPIDKPEKIDEYLQKMKIGNE